MIMKHRIMNNKGSISIEALITLTVMILLMAFMIQMMFLLPEEDLMTQYVYDALETLEISNYMYHKIGILDLPLPDSPYSDYLSGVMNDLDDYAASYALEEVLNQLLKKHEMTLTTYAYKEGVVSGIVSYEKKFYLGGTRQFSIGFEKRLWLFGNEKNLYPNHTLADLLDKERDEEKNITVYKTQTGEKYHLEGCFYLIRSTTNHLSIESMTLYHARHKEHLSPCKRCLGEAKWK